MPEQPRNRHVLADELLRFFEGELEEESEEVIAEHLEDCEECQQRAVEIGRTVVAMKKWTARTHGEAYRAHLHEAVRRGLEKAAGTQNDPSIAERLHRWMERGKGQAEAAVGIYFDAEEERYRISSDGLEALVRQEAGLRVRGLPELAGSRGSRGRLLVPEPDGDEQAAAANGDTALSVNLRVGMGGDEAELQPQMVSALSEGEATVQVLANRVLSVEIPSPESGRAAPLLLLIDSDEKREPRLIEPGPFRRGSLRARFENLQPGSYLILFEPPPAA